MSERVHLNVGEKVAVNTWINDHPDHLRGRSIRETTAIVNSQIEAGFIRSRPLTMNTIVGLIRDLGTTWPDRPSRDQPRPGSRADLQARVEELERKLEDRVAAEDDLARRLRDLTSELHQIRLAAKLNSHPPQVDSPDSESRQHSTI
jgi:hypothetical protein